ncbi:hypothetical protein GBA52_023882 [Prunus armeniaca]|nr:hypothetical protein GBA52_023882 [Prunus armeniaca]
MGRVRTKTVKKSSRQVIERYYSRMTLDFHTNKKILEEVAIIPSKRLRNKIAGFSTHLMKRIQKGPVRGISLKLQEEERERRMDYVPEKSAIKTDEIEVDKETDRHALCSWHGRYARPQAGRPGFSSAPAARVRARRAQEVLKKGL